MNAVPQEAQDGMAALAAQNGSLHKSVGSLRLLADGEAVPKLNTPVEITVDISDLDLTDVQKAALSGVVYDEETGADSYNVNGEAQAGGIAPIVENGETLLPLRQIGQVLGAEIVWNAANGSIDITMDGETVSVSLSEPLPGGYGMAVVQGGRTMAPLGFIADRFNANVVWDAEKESVLIVR